MENELEKNTAFFRFEDLRVYHKALDYIDWVNQITASFPVRTGDIIGEKFCHSAIAIAVNISEGSSRNKSQFVYYLKLAKSAIRECIIFTSLAQKRSFLDNTANEYSRNQLMELTKMIGALIGSLQRSSSFVAEEEDDF
ncbi:MAG: four helix bundle protein [Bacteroidota bacterium]|nr:four helix bundle protein [Bacteroidota bacterium]